MVSTRTMVQVRASSRRMDAILTLGLYNPTGVSPTERGKHRTGCPGDPADDPDALRLVARHGRLLPAPLGGAPLRGGGGGRKLGRGARDGGVYALDGARPGLDAPSPGAVRLQDGSGGGPAATRASGVLLRPFRGGARHPRRHAGAGRGVRGR